MEAVTDAIVLIWGGHWGGQVLFAGGGAWPPRAPLRTASAYAV
jgi:hypothetical protein